MEERIRNAVQDALAALGGGDIPFAVEWPADLTHGDFATNAALAASKALGKPPREIADALVAHLKDALGESVTKVEAAGPGFVNITLAPQAVRSIIATAAIDPDWGKGSAHEGRSVMVEYSCPNPFKEMHIGHLMSTIIGEAVARIIENAGARVLRDSYGGDVGPHVAKALWALQKEGVTDVAHASEVDAAYAAGARAYEESEDAKAAIDTLNQEIYREIYATESSALKDLWLKCREVCLEAFRDIYQVLGTKFDYYFFESEVTPTGMRVVEDGLERGVFEKSDGAVIYPGERKGLHTLVFITSRGTPTYEAKDIGLAFHKEERAATDEVIIETGSEQIGHFNVFLAALGEIAPKLAAKTSHISHGLLTLTTGKMSSRLGNTITASGLLKGVIESAGERNEDSKVAADVAVAAVKYMVLRQAAGGAVVFDPEKSLSLEGDSGPYLQYAYVRAKKLLTYASESAGDGVPDAPYTVERLIIRYPEVAARAASERAPHHIAQYLTKLASEWNSFYANEQVLGSSEETYKQNVARAFANTMEHGLALLAISVPERM